MEFKRYKYKNRTFNGKDLSHLDPIDKQWDIHGKRIKIKFVFSTHTFSIKADGRTANIFDKTNHFKKDNNRVFSLERYNDTKNLLIPFINNTIHQNWNIKKISNRDDFIITSRDYHIYLQFIPRHKYTEILISSAHRNRSSKVGARKRKGKPDTYPLYSKLI